MENEYNVAETLSEIVNLLDVYFKKDKQKINMWLLEPNPMLGGIKPFEMVNAGRADKLLKIMQDMIAGNIA